MSTYAKSSLAIAISENTNSGGENTISRKCELQNMIKSIEGNIEKLVHDLLVLAKEHCYNKFSKELRFILSKETEVIGENFHTQRKNRNKLNALKEPKAFDEIINYVKEIYGLSYDINLWIYKSEKHRTIIDIRYFLRSELSPEHSKLDVKNEPMLHCKIAIPPYFENERFDANWELGGIKHQWNMFWWKLRMKNGN